MPPAIKAPPEALYSRFGASRATRQGDWNLLWPNAGSSELYNLATDQSETKDHANAEPDRVRDPTAAFVASSTQTVPPKWQTLRLGSAQKSSVEKNEMTTVTHLECSITGERYEAGVIQNLSTAGWPLLVRYDLAKARDNWNRDWLANGPRSMWRYAPVLPVSKAASIVSLGEGWSPLLKLKRTGAHFGTKDLWLKDEGINPTGSFKARGLSCAISMCVELGIKKVAIPSAGNAASALAAYAAAAGLEAHIFMPQDVPQSNFIECKSFGANVTLVDGLISDCAKIVASRKDEEGWFDVSTLKEPYRIEGKKTMAYELVEQMQWRVPDVIFYPTGGGVGIIGMWKAFAEIKNSAGSGRSGRR